jgi:hypothetical protein
MALNFLRRNPPNPAQRLKSVGAEVIDLSGLALLMSVMGFIQTDPPMGEMGHFAHEIFAPLLFLQTGASLYGKSTLPPIHSFDSGIANDYLRSYV